MERVELDTQVAIVGAGPAGLAAAIELGSRGIACVLLERTERGGYAPRAKTTHTRAREHMRRWGIAGRLADEAPFGVDYPSNVSFVTRLGGKMIKQFPDALQCSPQRDERWSEHSQWIPQYKVEKVMREHVATLPDVDLRFGSDYLDFTQDEDAVTLRYRTVADGSEHTLRAAFLIGADGARSRVRENIGAKMIGTYGLSRNYNIIFRAPGLAEAHQNGPAVMYWQVNPEAPSLIGPMDRDDLWFFMPSDIGPDVTYSDEEAVAAIKASTGIDIPLEVLSSDEWVASRLLADRYRQGRVFLSGDACHLHPPFGGFGMNMGISDSVDLGWKIAAILQGWGGPGLLDSYEAERRPAHEHVLEEASSNHAVLPNLLLRPHLEEDSPEGEAERAEVAGIVAKAKHKEFFSPGVVLGFCYQTSPVIVDDGTSAQWQRSNEYTPMAIPGCLAPHRWLDETTSLYDRFGAGMTLLVLAPDRYDDIAAARDEAQESGTPLTIVALPREDLRAAYDEPLALIRPDQHVAWRGKCWPRGTDLLKHVTGRAG
ncbi:FAD-dependent monooxygenase [Novosphingobium terrae]|uniref:FAD-dependent monooxygenase n=1 Tax=Novosphingobium terrae TaxID=2726189 RepID=UPI00197D2653|nr:FAD-dependent monooxygenase [Novosphingobium terrae]